MLKLKIFSVLLLATMLFALLTVNAGKPVDTVIVHYDKENCEYTGESMEIGSKFIGYQTYYELECSYDKGNVYVAPHSHWVSEAP